MTWPLSRIEPTRIWVRPVADFGFEVMVQSQLTGLRSCAFRHKAEDANALARAHHERALQLISVVEEAEGRKLAIPTPELTLWEVADEPS